MTDIPPNQPPGNMPPPPGAYPAYSGGPYGPGSPYGMVPPQPRNGMGTAGMVLGIISIVAFFLSWIAVIIAILAIVFSAIGRKRAKQGLATNRGQATAGLVTGIIGAILGVAVLVAAIWFVDKAKSCVDQYPNGGSAYTQCVKDKITGNG